MATEPLLGTYITSVPDRAVNGPIYVYYQANDNSIMKVSHDDRKPPGFALPIDQNEAKPYSPLASIFAIARDTDIPEARVYAQNPSDVVIQKIPIFEDIGVSAAVGTKFSAAYDGNSVYIQFQKTGFDYQIFERNVKSGTSESVCGNVLTGTNITTVETSIRPAPMFPRNSGQRAQDPSTGGVGICRYMVYTGKDGYLWFNWIDHVGGPEIERVESLRPEQIWKNTPLALAPVIDILAIYFLNESGQISRVDRGDYGWGNPKVVAPHSIKPHRGTNLAAAKDMYKGDREVWVSYQREDGVISGFHDTVQGG
jgi:hypothetical protein